MDTIRLDYGAGFLSDRVGPPADLPRELRLIGLKVRCVGDVT
jgi:hypothetical protein